MSHANLMRHKMIEGQIVPLPFDMGSFDKEALHVAFQEVPRDIFAAASYKALAYSEAYIPRLDSGFLIPAPILARMLGSLRITPKDTILVVGGGGYSALISKYLGGDVSWLDHPGMCLDIVNQWVVENSIRDFHSISILNSFSTYQTDQCYDVILVEGAVHGPLLHLQQALKPGGRLLTPRVRAFLAGQDFPQVTMTLTTHTADQHHDQDLFTSLMPFFEKREA